MASIYPTAHYWVLRLISHYPVTSSFHKNLFRHGAKLSIIIDRCWSFSPPPPNISATVTGVKPSRQSETLYLLLVQIKTAIHHQNIWCSLTFLRITQLHRVQTWILIHWLDQLNGRFYNPIISDNNNYFNSTMGLNLIRNSRLVAAGLAVPNPAARAALPV